MILMEIRRNLPWIIGAVTAGLLGFYMFKGDGKCISDTVEAAETIGQNQASAQTSRNRKIPRKIDPQDIYTPEDIDEIIEAEYPARPETLRIHEEVILSSMNDAEYVCSGKSIGDERYVDGGPRDIVFKDFGVDLNVNKHCKPNPCKNIFENNHYAVDATLALFDYSVTRMMLIDRVDQNDEVIAPYADDLAFVEAFDQRYLGNSEQEGKIGTAFQLWSDNNFTDVEEEIAQRVLSSIQEYPGLVKNLEHHYPECM